MAELQFDHLSKLKFFAGIPDEQLQQLADMAQEVEFPARQIIFHEDDPAKAVYVVVEGSVSLVICLPAVGCRQIMELGDGELFGWSPLMQRPRLSDTARTLTPTKVLAFEGSQLLALCQKDPRLGFEFMHRLAFVLADRLAATRMQLVERFGVHLPAVNLESD